MKLKAKEDMQIFVTVGMIDEETPDQETATFQKGETLDLDVISENKSEYTEVQFGDGSTAYNLKKKDFTPIG
jgi:hypothetical protein